MVFQRAFYLKGAVWTQIKPDEDVKVLVFDSALIPLGYTGPQKGKNVWKMSKQNDYIPTCKSCPNIGIIYFLFISKIIFSHRNMHKDNS